MYNVVQHLAPQPLTDMAIYLRKGFKADEKKLSNDDFRTAAKVFAYAFSRIAIAGSLYYGASRFKATDGRITLLGTLLSVPATALFWSGKLLATGAQALKANYRTPLTKAFGVGLFQTLAALPLSGCYKNMGSKAGLLECVASMFVKLETADGRGF